MARQHALEPGDRPFLQRFGQQRVVRVGQSSLRDVPGLVPAEMRFVEQNPHQLGDGHRRMRVVELDGDLLGKRVPIGVAAPEAPHQIGQRAGDQKILLHEAQSLPHARRVVGIEHPREGFGRERLGHRADEIAVAELLEIEVIGRRRGPEPQRVDGLAAVADDGPIERDADQPRTAGRGWRASCPPRTSNEQFSLTSTFSCGRATSQGSGRRSQLSGCSCCQPSWMALLEDAVLVAQAVAHGRELHRGHRVEEAGRQPAESAVAQAGVGLLLRAGRANRGLFCSAVRFASGSSSRLVTLLASERPMRNSIER